MMLVALGASFVLFKLRAVGTRAAGGPRRVLRHGRRARKARATTTPCSRCSKVEKLHRAADRRRTSRSSAPTRACPAASARARTCTPARVSVFLKDWDKRDETTGEVVAQAAQASSPRCPACARRTQVGGGLVRSAASRCRSCSAARITRSSRSGATACSRASRQNPGLVGADSRLQGNAPADARADRPRARRGPRRERRTTSATRSRR